MHWTGDITRGAWIAERLSGWGVVGGTAPRGFEAYARIFHPAGERNWHEVTKLFGSTWHPAMQWGAITGVLHEQIRLDDGSYLTEPEEGRLHPSQLATLALLLTKSTEAPDATTIGIWHGWGELHPGSTSSIAVVASTDDPAELETIRARVLSEREESIDPEVARAAANGPCLELPHREYVLLDADVREFADLTWMATAGLGWRRGFGLMPNLMWPADRAWFVASEIDFDSTIVGGTRALVDAIIAHPELEAAEVSEDTDLSYRADPINPPPRNL